MLKITRKCMYIRIRKCNPDPHHPGNLERKARKRKQRKKEERENRKRKEEENKKRTEKHSGGMYCTYSVLYIHTEYYCTLLRLLHTGPVTKQLCILLDFCEISKFFLIQFCFALLSFPWPPLSSGSLSLSLSLLFSICTNIPYIQQERPPNPELTLDAIFDQGGGFRKQL